MRRSATGTLPDGRSWGSMSAVNIDIDGIHVWAGDRCGSNSCATSSVDPIVKLDPQGNVVQSFGADLIIWPHGMDVDADGNVWVVDARAANARELEENPAAAGKGHTVLKFSPNGELLMTLGTGGEAGDPPTHFDSPNDVLIAPNGNIFVADTHGAQFQDEAGPLRRAEYLFLRRMVALLNPSVNGVSKMVNSVRRILSQWILRVDSSSQTAAIIVFRYSTKTEITKTRGISSAASVACSSISRPTCFTQSTLSLILTTTQAAGVRVFR